jgi:hypothetical protein
MGWPVWEWESTDEVDGKDVSVTIERAGGLWLHAWHGDDHGSVFIPVADARRMAEAIIDSLDRLVDDADSVP